MQTTPTWPPAERHHDETAGHHKVKPIATKAKPAKVLYPDLPDTKTPWFWLAAYFRDVAEEQAIKALIKDQQAKIRRPPALLSALHNTAPHLKKRINQSLEYVIEEGSLLFAHQDTTIFDIRVAA